MKMSKNADLRDEIREEIEGFDTEIWLEISRLRRAVMILSAAISDEKRDAVLREVKDILAGHDV